MNLRSTNACTIQDTLKAIVNCTVRAQVAYI